MEKENVFEKVLGVALTLSKTEQKDYLNEIDKDWFQSKFLKDVFEGICKLSDKGEFVDILNLTTWLRENDRLETDTIYKVTCLTSNIGFTDTVNKGGVLNECWYNFSVRKTFLMLQNVNQEMQRPHPRSNYILDEVTKVADMLSSPDTIQEDSNVDSIDYIINKHNDAQLGIPIGLELGWDNLRGNLILEPDDVMVVGGRPAMGKTAWAIAMMVNLCFRDNKVVVFYSLEMAKDRIIRRIISNLSGIDSNSIKYGKCSKSEINALDSLKNHEGWDRLHILDGSQSVKDIELYLTKVKSKYDVDLFCIDYLQKIMPTKGDSRYQEVTKISNDVKRVVMSHRVPCIALAQLNRDVARSGKRPSLPDLKESGEIEQDASIVSFLHRPEYYGETHDDNGNDTRGIGEFIIAKNRDGGIGIHKMKVVLETSEWNSYDEYQEIFEKKEKVEQTYDDIF